MKYICNDCNYTTCRKDNYNLHINTNKHKDIIYMNNIKNIENKILSNDITINNINKNIIGNDKVHNQHNVHNVHNQQSTDPNNDIVYKLQMKIFKDQIDSLTRENETLKTASSETIKILKTTSSETIKILKDEVNSYKSMITGAGGLMSQSMNVISYLVQNHQDAPPLLAFDDCSIIKKDIEDYACHLFYYYKHNILIKHVSDCILGEYKTNDPTKQVMWSSDASRLTYIIKELLKDNTSNWFYDKKGVKVCKYIIDPLLSYIRKEIKEYINGINLIDDVDINHEEQIENFQIANKIIDIIDNNSLRDDILKDITPHFFIDKKILKTLKK